MTTTGTEKQDLRRALAAEAEVATMKAERDEFKARWVERSEDADWNANERHKAEARLATRLLEGGMS